MVIEAAEIEEIYRSLGARQREPGCEDLLQFRSLTTAHQYSRLIRMVQSYVPEGSQVLDWGCGNGHFSSTLRTLGYLVSGYSFADFGLRKHIPPPYSFTLGDGEDPVSLPYESNRFEAVVSVGVLEHVRETGGTEAASLAEIKRILKPGGCFICYHFPNRFSWIEMVRRRFPDAPVHRFRYTRADITALCDAADLECLRMDRYAALPRNFWHLAPTRLRLSSTVARLWDALDDTLAVPLNPFCQNHAFVARKRVAVGKS
jgi:SAM-dependent methyltransferase